MEPHHHLLVRHATARPPQHAPASPVRHPPGRPVRHGPGHPVRHPPDRPVRHAPGRTARIVTRGSAGLLLALLLAACGGAGATVAVGAPAPDLSARTLGSDQEVALTDLAGDVVLLNVWATWCDPCLEEMPFLESLHRDHREAGLQVLGINIDGGNDAAVTGYVDRLGVTFPNLRDPAGEVQRRFQTRGVPESFLIDRQGDLVHRWYGPLDTDPTATEELVLAALADTVVDDAARLASVGLLVAFAAGLLSFLSPCVLPLVPTYLAVITGRSVDELTVGGAARRSAVANAALFVAGFSVVFILLGVSAGAVGQVATGAGVWIARVGGVVVALLGLHLLGVVRWSFLQREARALDASRRGGRRLGRAGTALIGMGFAAGWTPCIGPILASILTVSATTGSVGDGLVLLASYSLGMAVPFLVAALALGQFIHAAPRFRRWLPVVERVSGVLCLGLAALLLSGWFERLGVWLGGG
jgi:cytochrome c-type biogenesis protein